MRAEIISIGDELLIGQTVNTNASWLGSELALLGIKVHNCQTISDSRDAIIGAFDLAFNRSDLIIVTGGLGPTKDDITKHVLCDYFDSNLVIDEEVLQKVTDYFKKRNRPLLEVNRMQAALPDKCVKIDNKLGTASGMWFEKEGKILISLPGVPYEMKGMMTDILLDKIVNHFRVHPLFHRTMLTTGVGESFIADKIADLEEEINQKGMSLAYLPSPGLVKLRITSFKGQEQAIDIENLFQEIRSRFPKNCFGEEEDVLSEVVGKLLLERGQTVSTVESCTGGAIAAEFTAVSGASSYYKGSLVSYVNEVKISILGVESSLIDDKGVVSAEVAEAMAQKGREELNTDFCLSCTGVAGPTGGTEECPVGTIWLGYASKNKVISRLLNLGENRERNIRMTVLAALNLLRNEILDEFSEKK